jgi:hypothetical protein
MLTPVNSNTAGNKTIIKVVKLSIEYPKTAENAKLLKQYLQKNGRSER